MAKKIFYIILELLLAFAGAVIFSKTVAINCVIPSESMCNTLMVGDRVIASRIAYKIIEPERFDIIVFRYPDDEDEIFIKRIIGLPGEDVFIQNNHVYIGDSEVPLNDSFIKEPMVTDNQYFKVPEGCYFVMGDNRNESYDSRDWETHYVEADQILGKAEFRYFPFNKMCSF